MKKFLLLSAVAALMAMPQAAKAQNDLIFAMDQVRSSNNSDPLNYVVQDGVDVIISRSGTDINGNVPSGNFPGVNSAGSTDGSIGGVVAAGVSTATSINGESWRWVNGALTANFDFAITDTSGANRVMTTFHFDGGATRPNAARDFELFLVEGAVETSLATGMIPLVDGGSDVEYTNFDLALGSGVALDANSTVTLSLRFTRTTGFDASNVPVAASGHHGHLDNVGIGTGAVVMEPLVMKGDVDVSGIVDFADIPAFIAVLQGGGDQPEADCDCSGVVDFSDIPAFIAILQGG